MQFDPIDTTAVRVDFHHHAASAQIKQSNVTAGIACYRYITTHGYGSARVPANNQSI